MCASANRDATMILASIQLYRQRGHIDCDILFSRELPCSDIISQLPADVLQNRFFRVRIIFHIWILEVSSKLLLSVPLPLASTMWWNPYSRVEVAASYSTRIMTGPWAA